MPYRISASVFGCYSCEVIPDSQRLEIHSLGYACTANHFSVGISATARQDSGITQSKDSSARALLRVRMTRALGSYALLLVSLGLAAGEVRAMGGPEPLWAYGYSTPPLPSDKPLSQTPRPSTRELRTTEPPYEQTRLRRVEGSAATYSKVDIRDGGLVADWFPGDHPTMSHVLARGPVKLGATSWGC